MTGKLDELRHWLVLANLPGFGSTAALTCLKTFQTPSLLLSASESSLRYARLREEWISVLKKPDWDTADRCLEFVSKHVYSIISWDMLSYPALLREISSPPLVLFLQGNQDLLHKPTCAVVGARHPSPGGLEIAYFLASELSQLGWVVSSGLALGIDGASHKGALKGPAKTMAVLGTGLDQCYPTQNKALAKQIVEEGGLLVSEFYPGTLPKAKHFPRRNRLISGLSAGVLVVEAAVNSGSLITARYALDQDREVFAVPGSILNPLSRGCHALIKQGAKLVESIQDILEELPVLPASCSTQIHREQTKQSDGLWIKENPQAEKILECLGFETTAVDTVIARSHLAADVVMSHLMKLELQGHICAVPGGYIKK